MISRIAMMRALSDKAQSFAAQHMAILHEPDPHVGGGVRRQRRAAMAVPTGWAQAGSSAGVFPYVLWSAA